MECDFLIFLIIYLLKKEYLKILKFIQINYNFIFI